MIPKQLFERPDHLHSPVYILTTVFNSPRFRSRWELYHSFRKHIEDLGGTLFTAEIAFGNRDFAVTEANNPQHLQLRTKSEIWHKERALNLLTARLDPSWEYVCFVDADIHFIRPDIIDAIRHGLQHYSVLQPWSEALDLDPDYVPFMRHQSFCKTYSLDMPLPNPAFKGYYGDIKTGNKQTISWHPGFAVAFRRDAFDAVGGLIDWGLAGAGDNHLMHSLIGNGAHSVHPKIHRNYLDMILNWEERAIRYIRKNIGCLDGLITHSWHGPKKGRKYWERWSLLVDNQYDPMVDLIPDYQGLYQLGPRSISLRDDIRSYLHNRNEDSIDLPPNEIKL